MLRNRLLFVPSFLCAAGLLALWLGCTSHRAELPASVSIGKAPEPTSPTPTSMQASASTPVDKRTCHTGMVEIPGGNYTMYVRQTQDTVPAFCLDVTEVTVAAYKTCVDAGRCTKPDEGWSCNWGVWGRGNHPINCVDWDQATTYCEWAGGRLPSEEEWEWAARGGDRGWPYPWGNDRPTEDAVCSSGLHNRQSTCPVGSNSKDTNRWGVKDLASNVWEWTSSQVSISISGRVVRGGSWGSNIEYGPDLVSAGFRGGRESGVRAVELGFRCSRGL